MGKFRVLSNFKKLNLFEFKKVKFKIKFKLYALKFSFLSSCFCNFAWYFEWNISISMLFETFKGVFYFYDCDKSLHGY